MWWSGLSFRCWGETGELIGVKNISAGDTDGSRLAPVRLKHHSDCGLELYFSKSILPQGQAIFFKCLAKLDFVHF